MDFHSPAYQAGMESMILNFLFQLVILSVILQKPDKHIFLDVKIYLIRVNEMIIS